MRTALATLTIALLLSTPLAVVGVGITFADVVAREREHGREMVELRVELLKAEAAQRWHMENDSTAFAAVVEGRVFVQVNQPTGE